MPNPEPTQARLRQLFSDLSGLESESLDPATPFFELGLDSLVLTQAVGALNKQFGVKIKFRELLNECSTIAALADRIVMFAPPVAAPVAADHCNLRRLCHR